MAMVGLNESGNSCKFNCQNLKEEFPNRNITWQLFVFPIVEKLSWLEQGSGIGNIMGSNPVEAYKGFSSAHS